MRWFFALIAAAVLAVALIPTVARSVADLWLRHL